MKDRLKRHLGSFAAAALLLGSTGCGQAGAPADPNRPAVEPTRVLAQPGNAPAHPTAPSAAPQLGKLTVILNWPEVRLLQAKVLPDSSTSVVVTVSAFDIPTPITTTVTRSAGQTSVAATLTVPTGTNRSILAEAKTGSTLKASGTAAGVTIGSAANNVAIAMAAVTVPAITSLSVASGGPGVTVTLTGTNFIPAGTTAPSFSPADAGTTVWNVKFNGTAATISAWSNTSITCTVSTGGSTGNIVVTADATPSVSTANFQVIQTITLSPANPNVNATATQAFTATVTDTTGAAVTSPVLTWASSDTAVGTITSGGVLTGVKGGTTTVSATSGTISGTTTAYVKPTISSLSASSGVVGSSLTVNGQGYGATQGTSTVTVGGSTATVSSWSNTAITITVPAAQAGSQNVVVTVGSQASATSAFTVKPNITSLSPTTGTTGISLTINGTTFSGASGTVTIGGTSATATDWMDTRAIATVPTSLTPGAHAVVVTANGTASDSATFTVRPDVSSLSPTTGTAGSSVTISGSNFGSSQGSSTVTIGGTTATIGSWSNTSISATVPSSLTPGSAAVVVTVNSVASNSSTFTVRPDISSINPTAGAVTATVTITGTNFGGTQGTSTVKFNGTAATASSWSDTSITVTVPSGATDGNVVVNVNAVDSNGVSFDVQ